MSRVFLMTGEELIIVHPHFDKRMRDTLCAVEGYWCGHIEFDLSEFKKGLDLGELEFIGYL